MNHSFSIHDFHHIQFSSYEAIKRSQLNYSDKDEGKRMDHHWKFIGN